MTRRVWKGRLKAPCGTYWHKGKDVVYGEKKATLQKKQNPIMTFKKEVLRWNGPKRSSCPVL
jgi:hypothetical protein